MASTSTTKNLGRGDWFGLLLEVSSTSNVANNNSSVTATLKAVLHFSGYTIGIGTRPGTSIKIDGQSGSFTGAEYEFSSAGTRNIGSVTKTVGHNNDGKKTITVNVSYPIESTIQGTYYGTVTMSVSLALDAIPRASTFVSAEGYWTEGGNPKIVVDKKYSGYTHKLNVHMSVGSGWILIAGPLNFSGTSYTVPLTENATYVDRIYKNSPNHLNYTLRYTVDTYSGSTKIGSAEKSVAGKNHYAKPALSGVYYKDGNSTIVGRTGSDQIIVQRLSTLNVGVTCAATKHATLKQLKMEGAGLTTTINLSGTSGSYYRTVGTPKSVISSVKITLTDSRGQTHVVNHPITMIAWSAPQLVHASADRRNSYEQDTYFNSTLRRSIIKIGGADINGTSVRYRVKPKNSSTWGSWVVFTPLLTSTSGNTATEQVSSVFMDNYPNGEAFDLQFAWKDLLEDEWRTQSGELSKGIALMSFYQDMIKAGVDLYVKDSKVVTEANPVVVKNFGVGDPKELGKTFSSDGQTGFIRSETPYNFGNVTYFAMFQVSRMYNIIFILAQCYDFKIRVTQSGDAGATWRDWRVIE